MKQTYITPDAATSAQNLAGITDKKGFANRWLFAPRTIDNMLRDGLPHLKIGKRRVRIVIPEADEWMKERFGQHRRGAVRVAAVA